MQQFQHSWMLPRDVEMVLSGAKHSEQYNDCGGARYIWNLFCAEVPEDVRGPRGGGRRREEAACCHPPATCPGQAECEETPFHGTLHGRPHRTQAWCKCSLSQTYELQHPFLSEFKYSNRIIIVNSYFVGAHDMIKDSDFNQKCIIRRHSRANSHGVGTISMLNYRLSQTHFHKSLEFIIIFDLKWCNKTSTASATWSGNCRFSVTSNTNDEN